MKDSARYSSIKGVLRVGKKEFEITNNIRTLRFFAGEMTQQQLASELGVSRQTIISLENGKYNPSILLAHSIARLFGERIEDIFIFEEEEA